MPTLVLLRHGESTWNKENRFTGWTDVDLSDTGLDEAHEAGRLLRDDAFRFDVAYTSVLKRAIRTLWIALDELDQMWCPVRNTWRLNERHYGALQGLNKAEMAVQFGEAQVKLWRRSYDVPPPALTEDDERFPGRDPRYADLADADIPRAESLKDTVARFLPYWESDIAPDLRAGKRVLVAAHGNSLRASSSTSTTSRMTRSWGSTSRPASPLVYDLDENLRRLARAISATRRASPPRWPPWRPRAPPSQPAEPSSQPPRATGPGGRPSLCYHRPRPVRESPE